MSTQYGPTVNQTRNKAIALGGETYDRWALRTPVIGERDDLEQVVRLYALPYLQPGDVLFLSEKMVACTQGRAIPLEQIRPRLLARILCRFVRKTSYGIGLAMPETMEMAIRECGTPKILLAAFCGMVGKLLGRRGWFYRVAGEAAAAIDGPCDCTIPPYNRCVVLAPKNADQVACRLAQFCGVPVLIVDINDIGGKVLGGSSPTLDRDFYARLLRDNPLEQGDESTPMGILRRQAAHQLAGS